MANHDIAVAISLGLQANVGVTRGNDLVFNQEYAPGLKCKVNLGACTKKRIEEIQEYLERLKIHAVDV